MITSLLSATPCNNHPINNQARPAQPDRESRQVARHRLRRECAEEIREKYGIFRSAGSAFRQLLRAGELVGYHEGFPRRARRRAARAKASRLYRELRRPFVGKSFTAAAVQP